MGNALLFDLQRLGYAATTTQLIALGHSRRTIGRAIETGTLLRVCRGWVATSDATQDVIIAIANAGKLTSSSALASLGIWDGGNDRTHVQVPRNSPRTTRSLRTPIARFPLPEHPRRGVVRHWSAERALDASQPPWRVSITDALLQASKHLPPDQLIACIDSALHQRALSRAGLPRLESLLTPARRGMLSSIDPTAESGLETLARVRLAPMVQRIETQVWIPGIAATGGPGRVDLLVNGWLVVELDGDKWHDRAADRRRDGALVRQGYRGHRFGYDQVMFGWLQVEETVLELLRYPPPGDIGMAGTKRRSLERGRASPK
jgi:very-short-patch-repair endonuclease